MKLKHLSASPLQGIVDQYRFHNGYHGSKAILGELLNMYQLVIVQFLSACRNDQALRVSKEGRRLGGDRDGLMFDRLTLDLKS